MIAGAIAGDCGGLARARHHIGASGAHIGVSTAQDRAGRTGGTKPTLPATNRHSVNQSID
jgi:hypothetical protein